MTEKLHFLGIAGHAMRGIALAAQESGHAVTGTDPGAKPPGTDWLDEHGITWWDVSDASHLEGVTKVIISGHTQPDDPEVAEAQRRRIPIQSFAEFVGELTKSSRTIVVAGTHGKTTTTSLLAWIFESSGKLPDYLVGIKPNNFDSSVRLKGSPYAILEGDEYRASQLTEVSKFSYYHPNLLVVTSIEMDHPDFFHNLDDIRARFTDLAAQVQEGRIYVSETVSGVETDSTNRYGFTAEDGWCPSGVEYTPAGLHFTVRHGVKEYGEVTVPLYGRHNVVNSLVATAVALDEGIPFPTVQDALKTFRGASRRFARVSAPDASVAVFDDYAHHPSEVKTMGELLKLHFPEQRAIVVFQPHTYSRTKELLDEYAGAFTWVDQAFITKIEGAREQYLAASISGQDVADRAGDHVRYIAERDDLLRAVVDAAEADAVVLSMSVGGNADFVEELARVLAEKFRTGTR